MQTENLFVFRGLLFILAIAKALYVIDLELEKIGMDLVDSSLPIYIYNRETGQITLR